MKDKLKREIPKRPGANVNGYLMRVSGGKEEVKYNNEWIPKEEFGKLSWLKRLWWHIIH